MAKVCPLAVALLLVPFAISATTATATTTFPYHTNVQFGTLPDTSTQAFYDIATLDKYWDTTELPDCSYDCQTGLFVEMQKQGKAVQVGHGAEVTVLGMQSDPETSADGKTYSLCKVRVNSGPMRPQTSASLWIMCAALQDLPDGAVI